MALRRLVAAIDAGPIASTVIETAEALLPVLADRLDIVTVGAGDGPEAKGWLADSVHEVVSRTGDDAGKILVTEAASGDVAAVVIGLRSVAGGPRPAGHVPTWLITHCEAPVIVIPPQVDRDTDPLSAILLPLEGGIEPSPATTSLVDELERGGASVDCVHVFDRTSTPLFWDRWQDPELYADQFSDQFSPARSPTELRAGDVAAQILAAAEAHGSSLILLEWKRKLAGTHAPVVRDLLCNTPIPLMLVPVTDPSGHHADDHQ